MNSDRPSLLCPREVQAAGSERRHIARSDACAQLAKINGTVGDFDYVDRNSVLSSRGLTRAIQQPPAVGTVGVDGPDGIAVPE
jgi:hypothetical protein